MHDVNRDSLLPQRNTPESRKKGAQGHPHQDNRNHSTHSHPEEAHNQNHDHDHDHDHDHNHDQQHHAHAKEQGDEHAHHDDHDHHDHDHHDHDDEMEHGHDHDHDDSAYVQHQKDDHIHHHDNGHEEGTTREDRAYAHLHEHGHSFYHQHHHTHHPEHAGVVHKVFRDPVRDWFGIALMGLLIAAGYYHWVPGQLAEGLLVCAAIMGIFPILKNALFDCLRRRKLSLELILGLALLAGLIYGWFLQIALIAMVLLLGSFMRLNFSWKDD